MGFPRACGTGSTLSPFKICTIAGRQSLDLSRRILCPIHFQTQCYAARLQNARPHNALPMGSSDALQAAADCGGERGDEPAVPRNKKQSKRKRRATLQCGPRHGLTHIASQPRPLTITGTPSPETHNHHRLQRCPSACLLCASSQIHWRGLAAQQRLGNLPDCLLNTCCSRWRRQMPHTAVAQLLPMQSQKTMPTISTSGLPINTLAGDSSWQIVYNSGRKTNDKPAAPPKHPLRMQRQCGATTALCCMQLPGHFVRDV